MCDEKNLLAIKRIDPFADRIVTHSANAATFSFNVTENKWEKTDVDGPLFVYRRIDAPMYSIMIANRQSLTDFIEPVTKELKLKYEPPYILMYKPNGIITALWVYGEDQCKRIYDVMSSLRGKIGGDSGPEITLNNNTDTETLKSLTNKLKNTLSR